MIGSLISISIIWLLTIILLLEAVSRFYTPVHIDARVMLITSTFGIIANFVMLFVLGHGHSHGGGAHDHGHSHGMKAVHGDSAQQHDTHHSHNGGDHGHAHGQHTPNHHSAHHKHEHEHGHGHQEDNT